MAILTRKEWNIFIQGNRNFTMISVKNYWQAESTFSAKSAGSYSLTMIPHWYRILDHARFLLSPEGILGVVDFYVPEKFPLTGLKHHTRFTRHFWPFWFSHDNVFLNADHLPYLLHRLEKLKLFEGQNSLPYLPVGQVPYYSFIGKKALTKNLL